jgi:cytochrome c biogenesis protein CcmG/thiol:disulfide interchange protein DsbE
MNATRTLPVAPRRSLNGFLIIGTLATFALLGLFAFSWMQRQAPPLEQGSAPPFAIKTFQGETLRSADLRGKAVLVNFWASWCVECRNEAALLQSAWQKYSAQGLVVIGIDYVDTESEATKYMQEFGITYPNAPDLGTQVSHDYRITGVPESYFITRDGKILQGKDVNGRALGNWIGPIPASALEERIQKILAP